MSRVGVVARPVGAHRAASDGWRAWCRGRPLLAGACTFAGGLVVVFLPAGAYTVLLLPGLAGVSGFLLGGMLCVCGLCMVWSPGLHGFLGLAAALVALTALVSSNIGGFLLGTLLGLLGGSLAFAWTPGQMVPERK